MIDGNLEKRMEIERVYEMLDEFSKIVGAKKISHPHIVKSMPHAPGVTGFVVNENSHITVHTFETEMKVLIDILNCDKINSTEIFKYLENFGFVKILHTHFITREV